MTATRFFARAEAAIDRIALACANEPEDVAEHIVAKFSADLRADWRAALPWLRPADVDAVVDDMIARARLRRARD